MRKISVSRKTFDMLTKCYRIGGFVLVVLALATFSNLIDKSVEFTLMFISYFISKGKFKYQWHSESMKHCIVVSMVVFSLCVLNCLPTTLSITFSGILGLIIAYSSYRIGYLVNKSKKCDELEIKYQEVLSKLDNLTKFKVNGATYERLEQRCRLVGMKESQIEFCIRAFTNHFGRTYTDVELADYYNVELQSIRNKKYQYRKKLEN